MTKQDVLVLPYTSSTPGQKLVLGLARLLGWRVRIDVPIPDKCVIVGAHHTSGLDFLATLLLIFGGGVRLQWVAKDVFFRPPFGLLLRAIGGIGVKRGRRNHFVSQMVEAFADAEQLRLAIAAEGTRQQSKHWKTGFYHIAREAGVPILFGYADYSTKVVGIGGMLVPTEDIEADFARLRAFYDGVRGRYPHLHSEIVPRLERSDRVES